MHYLLDVPVPRHTRKRLPTSRRHEHACTTTSHGHDHAHTHASRGWPPSGDGTVMLDIGDGIGALVVHTPAALLGVEIEIARRG